ncbi:hypothetical protein MTP09_07145 [Chryseobacterium suipulveris]|uniref:Uncharacterized protein n=1 Tax=Chryseobacterium suipulveris TaxID=2929800 RepID=A0ABY4C0W5_9FLAO|nr:hypothetical protein [Chryseobacterium suipulveris]UOE42400.1 hypothetical protein MTP09_07145 [Chryseobacterium suipulveris]
MKKFISVLAITVFTIGFAQEAPKKACCAGKDKKECKMDNKKTAKACDMKGHKDCKNSCDAKAKKEDAKKAA